MIKYLSEMPMIEDVGMSFEQRTKDVIADWCRSIGVPEAYAVFAANVDYLEFGDCPVFLIGGLPFILYDSMIVPYLNNRYLDYKRTYEPVLRAYGGVEQEGLFYPMMPQHDSFRAYMKAIGNKWTGNLLGVKAERVPWRCTESMAERDLIGQLFRTTFALHTDDMQKRHKVNPLASYASLKYWDLIPSLPDSTKLFYAVDTDQGEKLIAAMIVDIDEEAGHIDCAAMGMDHSDEYRPYSLATCSQLAVARYAMERGIKSVHYGLNEPGVGEYKRMFSVCEPIIGLTLKELPLI